jgi:hypothetical protein
MLAKAVQNAGDARGQLSSLSSENQNLTGLQRAVKAMASARQYVALIMQILVEVQTSTAISLSTLTGTCCFVT